MAAAAAEAHALAEVEHPNIVRIHNFVEHVDAAGVAGRLHRHGVRRRDHHSSRSARRTTLLCRPEQAVAYIVEIAPALGYLHAQGLAYCDFKPDNVMQADEQLKLIDLGAAVPMDDEDCAIFGTVGYQAPEIARTGPTVASDVYTVGRTLAVLVMDVPQKNGRFVEQLPGPDNRPVLAKHESLYRAIRRATDPDPRAALRVDGRAGRPAHRGAARDRHLRRGRRAAATHVGALQPAARRLRSGSRRATGSRRGDRCAVRAPWSTSPTPAAAVLATTSGTPPARTRSSACAGRGVERIAARVTPSRSRCDWFAPHWRSARRRTPESGLPSWRSVLPDDWRLPWYRGQCALLEGAFDDAASRFRCGADDAARRARSQGGARGHRRTARRRRRGRTLLRDGLATRPDLCQRRIRTGAAARQSGRPGRARSPHSTRSRLRPHTSPRQVRPRSRSCSTTRRRMMSTSRR